MDLYNADKRILFAFIKKAIDPILTLNMDENRNDCYVAFTDQKKISASV